MTKKNILNKRKKAKSRNNSRQKKAVEKSNEKVDLISLEECEENMNSSSEEEKNIKLKNKKANRIKSKDFLKKKKFLSKSSSKENKGYKKVKKEEIEVQEEIEEEDEEESEEEEDNLEDNQDKKEEVFIALNDKQNKKGLKMSKIKENIESLNISDYQEDSSLTCKNHNIIEDCCLECNEKNIFRAIKTNDKTLFIKCLKDINKISSIDYELPMLRGMTPLEYIIKVKNKTLYSEYTNYLKKQNKENKVIRISLPENKLEYLNSGKKNYYNYGYHTRNVGLSRGNKLGNNAFLIGDKNEDFDDGYLNNNESEDNIESIFFHEDEDFNFFNNFAKHQELEDYQIENLLEENISKGNIDIVEYLMSIFAAKNEYNYNNLHEMVTSQKPNSENNIEIKNKMSLNKHNYFHITPVHLSCINPNEKILQKLLENGGEVNFPDKLGRKPIFYAAMCKGSGPLKLLVENCDLNDRDKNGFTPLIHACRRGRYENVKLLLEKGADPLLRPKAGKCMGIHYACMEDNENNLKIVKILIEKYPELININGSGRKSPLHFAVIYNCPKIVELLVKKGANLDKKDKYWRTPLLLACKYGYSNIAEFLIKCGAKINKSDNSNNSPLHYACAFGNLDCVKILLNNGADINYLNMWKNLPIEIALLKNHMGIVNYLINNNKFSVNTPFGNGNNFLLYYLTDIDESTFDKIKYIIETKKANAKISNSNKMNAFHFLSYFTYKKYLSNFLSEKEIAKLNEQYHKNKYHPEYVNILKKYIIYLKDNNCEVDLLNNIGQSPLFFGLKNKNYEFAKILIENYSKEINIKRLDNNGLNIFDYIFKNGSSLLNECIDFIKTMFKIYGKVLDKQFLNSYTRYGRNALLNLCEDYALHVYEKFYYLNKKNSINYIKKRSDDNLRNKYYISKKDLKEIFEISLKEFKDLINKTFYPLLEEFVKKGCDINCFTKEKKFVNNDKQFNDYSYFNNYGKIHPIMYLVVYPESEYLIKLIKKYKININCCDLKGQTLLMYLLEVQTQIKKLDKNNFIKLFDYLLNNCNNLSDKNNENKNLFVAEIEKGNKEEALKIYQKLGDKIDINYPYYNNYLTLFGKAFLDSNKNLIEFYLSNFKNIDLNKIDIKCKRNILHYVCIKNSTKKELDFNKFSKYLNLGVSLSQKDIFGRNPLFYLFINQNNEIKNEDPISALSYLLDSYEANLDKKNNKKNDLDLNSVDILGNSLIFYAVYSNASFCVSYLLNKGAEIKGKKNFEKNSIFSYAFLGNSTSLQELYNEVNDIKVFEDKLYNINKNPINDVLEKAEYNLENKDKSKIKNIKDHDFYGEDLFNFNGNKKQKNKIIKEIDNNLEKLYEENDEGIQLFSDDYEDEENDDDIYIDKNINNISFDFKEEDESEINNNSVNESSEDDDEDSDDMDVDDDNEDDESSESHSDTSSKNEKNKLSNLKDIYQFNYSKKLNNIISEYLSKELGTNHHHYKNNYIPDKNNRLNSRRYPEINSIKYKLYISKEKEKINQEKNEEKILSESLFKYCIENNNQNIMYYIMNKGYDKFLAISDCFSSGKYQLALTLLERFCSISVDIFKNKNEKGQNLLHILCLKTIEDKNNNVNIVKKIYKILTEEIKLKIDELDNEEHSSLYYAILNLNFGMMNLLTNEWNLQKKEINLFLQEDKCKSSPLLLLHEKLIDENLPETVISDLLMIIYLLKNKAKIGNIKYIFLYLLRNLKELNSIFKHRPEIKEETPNTVKAFIIFSDLFENKIFDINTNIDDKNNDMFFLSVITNNEALFTILIKAAECYKLKINYNKVNKEGKSLIHYIVSPDPLYSYQNTEILKSALKSGFNPNIKDKDNLYPLDYAKKYNYTDMINILVKYKALESKQKKDTYINLMEIESDEESEIKNNNNINYNYQKMSDKYYKEKIVPFLKVHNPVEDKTKILVTNKCGLKINNYYVYSDDNGCLYNINLSKVDIKKNLYGKFVYYHIQLLVNEKRNIYNLITRWGRFGDSGQYQNTPFTDLNEAIKEFNKIFSSKTKNNWEEIKNNLNLFEKKENKYELLKLTNEKPEINNIMDYFNEELKKIKIKIDNNNKSINPNTKELILYIIQESFVQNLERYNDDDKKKFNVLYFSKESLDKGLKILNELADLNDKLIDLEEKIKGEKIYEKNLKDENSNYNKNKREYKEVSQKILQLSNSYYEIIPFNEERNYEIHPINDDLIIKREVNKIISYNYIEDTLKLFLSSLYFNKAIDPINYIYKSLNKKIIPLNLNLESKDNKDAKIVKILLHYIRLYDTKKVFISNIFEIFDKNENDLGDDIQRRILLFHGTKAQNLLGILSKGLLIAPIEAKFTGNKYGNGIYLADSFWKAYNYCDEDDKNKKYILVVDTYLDKAFEVDKKNKFTGVKNLKKNKFNCLINNSKYFTDFEDRIYLNCGTTVPMSMIKKENNDYDDYYAEYVIYDTKLVNIKYIIELGEK